MSLEPRQLRLGFDFLRLLASQSKVEQRTIQKMVAAATLSLSGPKRNKLLGVFVPSRRSVWHGESLTRNIQVVGRLLMLMSKMESSTGGAFPSVFFRCYPKPHKLRGQLQ